MRALVLFLPFYDELGNPVCAFPQINGKLRGVAHTIYDEPGPVQDRWLPAPLRSKVGRQGHGCMLCHCRMPHFSPFPIKHSPRTAPIKHSPSKCTRTPASESLFSLPCVQRVMAVGIDVNHDSQTRPSVAAIVASMDPSLTYYNAGQWPTCMPREPLFACHGFLPARARVV